MNLLSRPARAVRRRLPVWPAAIGWLLLAGLPAESYRHYRASGWLVAPPSAAVRWPEERLPLRFFVAEHTPEFLDRAVWRAIVEESLAQWAAIPTATVRLVLEPGYAPRGGSDASDGTLTIRWEPDAVTQARLFIRSGLIKDCDVVMDEASFVRRIEGGEAPQDLLPEIRTIVLHEVGHCLGLDHTEPYPVAEYFWNSLDGAGIPTGYRPNTVMSYSWGLGQRPALTPDEETAVSLVYPAPGYRTSRGGVAGRFVHQEDVTRPSFHEAGSGVPGVYVQVVYPGPDPRMGPGAFSDADGYFEVDGLEPGHVLLWIHPVLEVRGNAHGDLLWMARDGAGLEILDEWRFVEIAPAEMLAIPDVPLVQGRWR